jgi:hypothetical protein
MRDQKLEVRFAAMLEPSLPSGRDFGAIPAIPALQGAMQRWAD